MTYFLSGLRERLHRAPQWLQWLIIAFILLTLSGILTTRYVYVHTALSPIDEYTYVDAVDKATRGVVVRYGSYVDAMAREAISCRGFGLVDTATRTMGRCGVAEPDVVYPWAGHSTGSIHSPVYYFVTAWLSKIIMAVIPGLHLITAARLTGALWLGLGALALTYLLRRAGVDLLVGLGVSVAVISMPGFRVTNSYITPDALNLLAGSVVFLAGLLYARREWGVLPFVIISMAVTVVKFQNCFAVVAVFLFLVWTKARDWWTARRGRRRRHEHESDAAGAPGWLGILLPPAAAVATGVGWITIQRRMALPTEDYWTDPPGNIDVAGSLYYMDDTLNTILSGNWSVGTPLSVIPSLGLWVAIAALCGVAWFMPGMPRERRFFAQAGAVSLLGIGPAVNLSFTLVFGSDVDMQPRYGMVLIPILALCAAWTVTQRRPLRIALALFASAAYLFALAYPRAS